MSQHIKDKAIEKGIVDGHEYWIVPGPSEGKNGYIVFKKRPVREYGYNGILSYVPVHGGITYADESNIGMVYGFDTAHHNSHEFPRDDNHWIKGQIEIMLKGIKRAAEVENKYLRCVSNKGKAKHCQYVADAAPDQEMGFGAMINMLSGEL